MDDRYKILSEQWVRERRRILKQSTLTRDEMGQLIDSHLALQSEDRERELAEAKEIIQSFNRYDSVPDDRGYVGSVLHKKAVWWLRRNGGAEWTDDEVIPPERRR